MRFRTGSLIARGGVAEVYRAHDPVLDRPVALKMLRGDQPEQRERFLREARLQAALDHPNVCEVYEVGELDGQPYIAMRWVDGRPLDRALVGRGLEERVRVLADVARALQAAHEEGLIHRDLKPSNVLVEETSDRLHPYVLDFGIARAAEADGPTMTGEVIGTPGYLSPEQARGELHTLDRRSDVFGLGCLLYEALAGRPAFESETPLGAAIAVLESEPTRLRKIAPAVPKELEIITERALQPRREDRYPSALALAHDLERWLSGDPIEARVAGPWLRCRRWARRNPTLATVVAAAIFLLAVAAGWVANERAKAEERARAAQRFGEEAERLGTSLRVANLSPLHDTSRRRAAIEARLEEIADSIEGADSLVTASAEVAMAAGLLSLGRYQEARAAIESARASGVETEASGRILARALAGLYRGGLETARGLSDPALRALHLQRIEASYRQPFLEWARAFDRDGRPELRLLAAEVALLEEDWKGVDQIASEVLAAEPWRYEAALLRGEGALAELDQARSKGDLESSFAALARAREHLREAVAIGRSSPEAHTALCRATALEVDLSFFSRGEVQPAQIEDVDETCTRAAASDSRSTDAHDRWSYSHVLWARYQNETESGDPFSGLERAIEIADAAIAIDPQSAAGHRRHGEALAFLAEFERERGNASRQTLERAIASLEQAVAIDSESASSWNALGLAQWERQAALIAAGEDPLPAIEDAIAAFRRAVDLLPGYAKAESNLATMYKRRALAGAENGESPEPDLLLAIEHYEAAITADPTYTIAYNNLGDAYLQRALLLHGSGKDPRPALGHAARRLEDALERNPNWAYPWFNLAAVHRLRAVAADTRGESIDEPFAAAGDAFESGLELRGNLSRAWSELAEIRTLEAEMRQRRGETPEPALRGARRALERAFAIDPQDPLALEVEQRLRALAATTPPSAAVETSQR